MAGPSGQTPVLHLPYPIDNDNVDVPRDIKALADGVEGLNVVPIGAAMMWPTPVAPLHWVLVNGQQVPAADWPRLAAAFPAWVAGGQITMPNWQQRFPLGAGGTDDPLETGGSDQIALAAANLPAHAHPDNIAIAAAGGHAHGALTSGWNYVIADRAVGAGAPEVQINLPALRAAMTVDGSGNYQNGLFNDAAATAAVASHVHGKTGGVQNNVGGGAPLDYRPRFFVVNFIMRGE
jgi:microcystin-dependent protein